MENMLFSIKFGKQSLQRGAVIASMLHVTSCYAGANQRGKRGNKTGQKMSKFKGRGRKAKEPVK